MDLKVLFLGERVRHYIIIFINAGHVACQDMVREKCYENKVYSGTWFTIRRLVLLSAEKTKNIN